MCIPLSYFVCFIESKFGFSEEAGRNFYDSNYWNTYKITFLLLIVAHSDTD